jgi:hypothetical protein
MMRGFFLSLMIAGFACSGTVSAKPVASSLCSISRNPLAYNGTVVRFRAAVLTDWHHGIQLFVKGCRGGVQLASTDAAPAADGRALDVAIGTPLDGGYDRTVVATFIGRIMWRPRTKLRPHFYNPLAIDVYRITDIETGPIIKPR